MPRKKVEVSAQGRADINGIVEYLLTRSTPVVAWAVAQWIERDIKRLGADCLLYPEMTADTLLSPVRKAPVWVWRNGKRRRITSWTLYCTIKEDRVYVVRVRHNRQKWFWEDDADLA